MPETGLLDAMLDAGIPAPTQNADPYYQARPVMTGYDIEMLAGADCICVIEKMPEPVDLEVMCQSVCQRPATPNFVDLVVLLKGYGTFSWDEPNSGFSIDDGSNWYGLDPSGGDPLASDTGAFIVTGQRPFTMVLDMDLHVDDWADQSGINYLLSFTHTA